MENQTVKEKHDEAHYHLYRFVNNQLSRFPIRVIQEKKTMHPQI